MDLTRFDSADALLEAAGGYLVEREAEHNLPLGILLTLREQPGFYREPPYLAAVRDGGRIALIGVRTPPHGLILSEPGVPARRIPAAVETLVDDLAAVSPDLPAVVGPKSTVEPFAARWSAVTGGRARLADAQPAASATGAAVARHRPQRHRPRELRILSRRRGLPRVPRPDEPGRGGAPGDCGRAVRRPAAAHGCEVP